MLDEQPMAPCEQRECRGLHRTRRVKHQPQSAESCAVSHYGASKGPRALCLYEGRRAEEGARAPRHDDDEQLVKALVHAKSAGEAEHDGRIPKHAMHFH